MSAVMPWMVLALDLLGACAIMFGAMGLMFATRPRGVIYGGSVVVSGFATIIFAFLLLLR